MAEFPLSSYKTPGVYVQEVQKIPPSIAQVDTAVPIFIGYTEIAERNGDSLIGEPTRITSVDQYIRWYGGPKNQSFTVEVTAGSSGNPQIKVPKRHEVEFRMYYAAQMFFDNGGGECYILSIGLFEGTGAVNAPDLSELFTEDIRNKLRKELEPTLIVFPDLVNRSTGPIETGEAYLAVYAQALDFCSERDINNYFVIMDVEQHEINIESPLDDAEMFRAISPVRALDSLQRGAAYYPYLVTTLSPAYDPNEIMVVEDLETGGTSTGGTGQTLEDLRTSSNQLFNQIIDAINNQTRLVLPPSAAMAGIYAAIDSTRGVFKAPANVGIANVIGPSIKISDKDHDDFNVDTTAGKSINVIRTFIGRGSLVWGARTLAGNDREWRYVSVRRYFNMVEESVKRALVRYVFEPNNRNTWISIRASIETFLETQWRGGALLGNAPDEAYFVNVGVPETFTEAEMLDGFMVVEIGMAVVRPAEFIVLKFMHKFELGQN